ncbi:glycosyltransferase [uncultured Clostridium sp.]|uniref:glycosyltransferase n=1 Tax=uncultured Clostridium sp. TaxID=59620 RepID=UPI002638C90F|nr:glycosyltransferase [uncultured Clostridium sp.]
MKKLSIIVPVYNVENYIVECLESLRNQTIDSLEIIVVDDGSKDSSIEKIQSMIDGDRVKLIVQENKGLSGARNTGLKVAKGEYVAFVDSDDYIGINTAYEEMYNLAISEKSEIVAGNCIKFYEDGREEKLERNMEFFKKSPMEAEEFFLNSLESNRVYAPVWLNIYKRDFLKENSLQFMEGVLHEDEEFTPRVLLKAKKVSIYNKDFYMYRQRAGSIMNSGKNKKHATDILKICGSLNKKIDEIHDERLKRRFANYLCSHVLTHIYFYELDKVDNEDVFKLLDRDYYGKNIKLRRSLLKISPKLYCSVENVYRSVTGKRKEK